MKRFERYFDADGEVNIKDVPAAEIEAVTDKKFVVRLTITDHFSEDCFDADPEDCEEEEYEEMCEYVKNNFDHDLTYMLPDGEAEFDGSYRGDTQWSLKGNTKPLTAQEVLKIKYNNSGVDGAYIIDLVEE